MIFEEILNTSLYFQLSGKRDEKLLQNLFLILKMYSQVHL